MRELVCGDMRFGKASIAIRRAEAQSDLDSGGILATPISNKLNDILQQKGIGSDLTKVCSITEQGNIVLRGLIRRIIVDTIESASGLKASLLVKGNNPGSSFSRIDCNY
jgi:hypothetical protein